MVGIEARCGYPGACFASDCCHVEDVIEVAVGDNDAANRLLFPTISAKFASQKETSADESSVE